MPSSGSEAEKPVVKRRRLPVFSKAPTLLLEGLTQPAKQAPVKQPAKQTPAKQPTRQAVQQADVDTKPGPGFDLNQEWDTVQQQIAKWKKELDKAQLSLELAASRKKFVESSLQHCEEWADDLAEAKAKLID